MEKTINIQDFVMFIKMKGVLLISSICVGVGIASIITFFFITPKYKAGTQLIVTSNNIDNNISTDSINSNLLMINTYKDFIKGRVVTEAASKKLKEKIDFTGDADTVKNMLNVEQAEDSQMFTITVTSDKPDEAAEVANVVADVFKTEAQEYTTADKVSIISRAEVPVTPVSPNKKVNLTIGGLFGLIIGVGTELLLQLLNKTVKSSQFITDTLNIPILGNISLIETKEINRIKRKQISALKAKNCHSELDDISFFEEEIDGLDQDLKCIEDINN